MSAPARGYVHAGTPYDIELARLRLLETRYDGITRARLARFGDLTGARCLEVGAGAGSVARILSALVGPVGEVLATDADPRFLTAVEPVRGGGPIEVRRHDILVDKIEIGVFDLVHCRALLLHLPDPERALTRMVAALRPGGWLLVEDADYTSFAAADARHPAAAEFDRISRNIMGAYAAQVGLDMTFGRRLPAVVHRLGLIDRGEEALEFRRRGASPEAIFFRHGFDQAGAIFGPTVEVADSDVAYMAAVLSDPGFEFVDSLNVGVWGRRPQLGFLG